ncbi:MAG TPA: MMPL family transporter [Solirubrobacter sp.]|nr:MMPL family transporter [Solirubrobacter sp.]
MSAHASPGLLGRITRRSAAASARRPKTVVALWLLLVVGFAVAGGMTGTKMLTGADAGVGESSRADARLAAAGLQDPAVESVLVRSSSAARTSAATADVARRARAVPEVAHVRTDLRRDGGRTALVQVSLRGDPDDAGEHVDGLVSAVDATRSAHPGVHIQAAGPGTTDHAIGEVVSHGLRTAELISLPVTLLILFLAFGALVAAAVPLLLGLTSVIAALGGMGLISQVAPMGDATSSLVVLLGLAVGVDYSLFYIRREREERRAGRDSEAALNATAATVGRAIVVSGVTVIAGLAGLLITGLATFVSMALATMLVVAMAVLGSLTVLPAVLALLGDRINRGRLPGMRPARGSSRAWGVLARAVTRRPLISLTVVIAALLAIASPALHMHTSGSAPSLPHDEPAMVAAREVAAAFPGAPSSASLVVTGSSLKRADLRALGRSARTVTGGEGPIEISLARDRSTALVRVPMPDHDEPATVARLREALPANVLVTGEAASKLDFTSRLNATTPLVIAFVLGLALLLLLASFRSLPLALAVIGLNLLSVGAAYGVLTYVFQNTWAEGLLGFTSSGTVADWVPLNTFVILFGLSMDYTILVLERIREARRAGAAPRAAAAEGVAATAGAVTSAAVVMVAIFAIFPTLPMVEMKMIGVALAAGVLIDATLVRGVALPAAAALLGRRGVRGRAPVYVPGGGGAARPSTVA